MEGPVDVDDLILKGITGSSWSRTQGVGITTHTVRVRTECIFAQEVRRASPRLTYSPHLL